MKITFDLTVKIEGSSLDEIDDGLMQAAGARLMSRIQKNDAVITTHTAPNPPPPQGLNIKTDRKEEKS